MEWIGITAVEYEATDPSENIGHRQVGVPRARHRFVGAIVAALDVFTNCLGSDTQKASRLGNDDPERPPAGGFTLIRLRRVHFPWLFTENPTCKSWLYADPDPGDMIQLLRAGFRADAVPETFSVTDVKQ